MSAALNIHCIDRSCLRDRIRDDLLARILDGRYPPGARLVELNLARAYNVSQAPVREALRELETLGLVESQRYRGTCVRQPRAADLWESYEMRAVLEARAAEMAVPCSAELLDSLAQDSAEMLIAATEPEMRRYIAAVVRFHRAIVVASGNRLFLQTWDGLQVGLRIHLALAVRQGPPNLEHHAQAHQAILAELRAGAGQAAGQLLRQLMERVLAELQP